MTSPLYLFGKNPLTEALLAVKRGKTDLIGAVYLTPQGESDTKLTGMLQSMKIPFERVTPQEIESKVGKDAIHQGVCAEINQASLYMSLDTALALPGERPIFVLLDELQDPHNVGAIIRSAAAFGATAILIPEFDQVQINGTIIKTSSGTVFAMPIVRIGNINTTLRELKDKGFWTYGLTGDGDTNLHQASFDTPSVIVIGSEGTGIREKTLASCDFKLSISIDKRCESLNASNAVAVTLYEWNKQQR